MNISGHSYRIRIQTRDFSEMSIFPSTSPSSRRTINSKLIYIFTSQLHF